MSSDESTEECDERGRDSGEQVHGLSDHHGDPLRVLQCQALRHQLADEEREVGDDPDDDDHRDRLGCRGRWPERVPGSRATGSESVAPPIETSDDADQRNADLDRRQKSVGMLGQPQRHRGPVVAFFRPLLQPGLA